MSRTFFFCLTLIALWGCAPHAGEELRIDGPVSGAAAEVSEPVEGGTVSEKAPSPPASEAESVEWTSAAEEAEAAEPAEGSPREEGEPDKESGRRPGSSPEAPASTAPAREKAKTRTAPEAPLTTYVVKDGETLWTIAARRDVYGDALLWPLIYKANRDQIKDPRQIYPKQILAIPRNVSDAEREEAREKARKSEIFPLEILMRRPAER